MLSDFVCKLHNSSLYFALNRHICIILKHFSEYFIFQAGRNCRDLFEDLRDGHNLLSLLEVLSGEILVRINFNLNYEMSRKNVGLQHKYYNRSCIRMQHVLFGKINN